MTREEIYKLIDAERLRQNEDHPEFLEQSDAMRFAVLAEEVGEVAAEVQSIGRPEDRLQSELVQVAATAIRWLEEL